MDDLSRTLAALTDHTYSKMDGVEEDDFATESELVGDEKDNLATESELVGDEKDNLATESELVGNEEDNFATESESESKEEDLPWLLKVLLNGDEEYDFGIDPENYMCLYEEDIDGQSSHLESSSGSSQTERKPKKFVTVVHVDQSNMHPNFYKFTKRNEHGFMELDIEKLVKSNWCLDVLPKTDLPEKEASKKKVKKPVEKEGKKPVEKEAKKPVKKEVKKCDREYRPEEIRKKLVAAKSHGSPAGGRQMKQDHANLPKNNKEASKKPVRKGIKKGQGRYQEIPEKSEDANAIMVPPVEGRRMKQEHADLQKTNKDKPWDIDPRLRETCKKYIQSKFKNERFTKKSLEKFSKTLTEYVQEDLEPVLNLQKRIMYPKLSAKLFTEDFATGKCAESEPIENIKVSLDCIKFLKAEIKLDFSEKVNSNEYDDLIEDLETNPQINRMMPSILAFLENNLFEHFEKKLKLILAVAGNPYQKWQLEYENEETLYSDEEKIIAEYLLNGFSIVMGSNDDSWNLYAKSVIMFASRNFGLKSVFFSGFSIYLDDLPETCVPLELHGSYCKILHLFINIGPIVTNLLLAQYFEKLYSVACEDRSTKLYPLLLKACELSIQNTIEKETWIKEQFDDEIGLGRLYTNCYYRFGKELMARIEPIFKKYKESKVKEAKYFAEHHAIFPTKHGYMNLETLYSIKMKGVEPKSSDFPGLYEFPCIHEDQIFFNSSHTELGFILQAMSNNEWPFTSTEEIPQPELPIASE